jgi:AcrR family transcriptional regulator
MGPKPSPAREPAAGPAQERAPEPVAVAAVAPVIVGPTVLEPALEPDPAPETPSEPDAAGDAPRSARREATRQRILDAAREVFAEMGVIGGTVEDICERAGFTRGAFYSNFTDKDDVVDALVEREHGRLLQHLDAAFPQVDREIAEAEDLATALGGIVYRILGSIPIDRQLTLIQTELEIFAIRRPDQAGRFLEINSRFRERISRLIEEAMHRYGRELLVDPAMITDSIVAIAERSVRRALLAGEGADPDAMASAVLPRLLLAVSSPAKPTTS